MNQSYQLYNLIFHIMQDTEYTPKWSYQKEPFLETEGLHDIPFRHCLCSGISSGALKQLFEAFAEKQSYNIHGLLVVHKGRCIFEKYAAPYRKQYRHVSYSMCKSVVSMAVGLAIDDKKLSLDTRVCDVFPQYLPQKKSSELKELTICHLLTMEAGVCFSELSQAFSTDWVKSYLRADFMFPPGEGFYYNSLNSYILCASLQQVYKESVMALLHRRIFAPLNIYDITWDTCPKGIEKGGFGMKLSLHDMAKLGLLYMNRGVWYGTSHKKAQRLLSEAYVTAATQKQIATENQGFDYGFHCWVMEDGFLFNGMLGQNVYVFPKQELIIATQSGSESFLPTAEMMADIRRFVYGCRVGETAPAGEKQPSVSKENRRRGKTADEKMRADGANDREQREFMEGYCNKTYRLEEPLPSVMPFFMQLFYQQITPAIRKIAFYPRQNHRIHEGTDEFYISFSTANDGSVCSGTDITVAASVRRPVEQHIEIRGQYYPVCVTCWLKPETVQSSVSEKRYRLSVRIDFLEEANSRVFEFVFSKSRLYITAGEWPSLDYLCGTLLSGSVLPVKLPKIPKRIPANMQEKINKLIKPETFGYEV